MNDGISKATAFMITARIRNAVTYCPTSAHVPAPRTARKMPKPAPASVAVRSAIDQICSRPWRIIRAPGSTPEARNSNAIDSADISAGSCGWRVIAPSTNDQPITPAASTTAKPCTAQNALDHTARALGSSRANELPRPPSASISTKVTVGRARA